MRFARDLRPESHLSVATRGCHKHLPFRLLSYLCDKQIGAGDRLNLNWFSDLGLNSEHRIKTVGEQYFSGERCR